MDNSFKELIFDSQHNGQLRLGNKLCDFNTYKKTDVNRFHYQRFEIDCPGSSLVPELRPGEDSKRKKPDVKIEHQDGRVHLSVSTRRLSQRIGTDKSGDGWTELNSTQCPVKVTDDKIMFPLDFGVQKDKIEV